MSACSIAIEVNETAVPAVMQPDTLSWEPPEQLGNDGDASPVYTPYWSCQLGFGKLTSLQYTQWFRLWDGHTQTITLPSPYDGTMTDYECFVHAIRPRLSTQGGAIAAAGVDIQLTHIYVDFPEV